MFFVISVHIHFALPPGFGSVIKALLGSRAPLSGTRLYRHLSASSPPTPALLCLGHKPDTSVADPVLWGSTVVLSVPECTLGYEAGPGTGALSARFPKHRVSPDCLPWKQLGNVLKSHSGKPRENPWEFQQALRRKLLMVVTGEGTQRSWENVSGETEWQAASPVEDSLSMCPP